MNVSIHPLVRVFFFLVAAGGAYATYMVKVQEPDFHFFSQLLTMMAGCITISLCVTFWPSRSVWWIEKLAILGVVIMFFGFMWLAHASGGSPGERITGLVFMVIFGIMAAVVILLPKRMFSH